MPGRNAVPTILVQTTSDTGLSLLSSPLTNKGVSFTAEEVFPASLAEQLPPDEPIWVGLKPTADVADQHRWDLAHSILESAQLLAGNDSILFVEPAADDNAFPVGVESSQPADSTDCTPAGQNSDWPLGPSFAWHLRDEYSQLKRARESVDFSSGRRVRIGHIDTGYDPAHVTRPRRLRPDLGANFHDGDGYRDPVDRFPYQPILGYFGGHGPSTLSVLAGSRVVGPGFNDDLGGAPEAEVIPIIANGGVIVTNPVPWIKSIEHAVRNGCDVISMSCGGVDPSFALLAAAMAVEQVGTVFCAAAGNRFCATPPITVMPAMFPTVISVNGALADLTPYDRCWWTVYAACHEKATDSQMAGYTPNTAKARRGCATTVDQNGDGTSHSTPQVAAAAALYIQKWQSQMPNRAQRPNMVRRALFASASNPPQFRWFYRQGMLKAFDALQIPPSTDLPASALPVQAAIPFPAFDSLPELEHQKPAARGMLSLEALQIARRSKEYAEIVSSNDRRILLEVILGSSRTSQTLRRFAGRVYRDLGGK